MKGKREVERERTGRKERQRRESFFILARPFASA